MEVVVERVWRLLPGGISRRSSRAVAFLSSTSEYVLTCCTVQRAFGYKQVRSNSIWLIYNVVANLAVSCAGPT